jgi:hypothetical protein
MKTLWLVEPDTFEDIGAEPIGIDIIRIEKISDKK